VDRSPLQAGPLLHVIVRTNHHDDEVGFFVVKIRQIDTEVAPGEFGFMELVLENGYLAEVRCEQGSDLGDEVSFFSSKGEGDAEAFGAHMVLTALNRSSGANALGYC